MAALTPVASLEALVSAIQKSGLLAPEALQKVRGVAEKATDPKHLARDLIKEGTLTKWQAGQLLHGYFLLTIGKYKLLDQLAAAPTGRIYLVEHMQMGRRHTLKVLARRLASNPKAVKQFLEAARNACGLDHRNISHVYDVDQDGDRHYVVMEHVEGETLEHLVEREGRLKLPQSLDFIAQAAEGLAHAHENGVVHGDLKPANLLRDQAGTIKILEMGQAGLGATYETEGADESIEMAALAAVIFQAPEVRGDGEVADVACDVYSVGSILSFLLSGKAAANAAAATAQLKALGDVPQTVIDLCGRLMAEKPADRPPTILAALEQLVAATQKTDEPPKDKDKKDKDVKAKAADSKSDSSTRIAAGKSDVAKKEPSKPAKERKPPVAKPLDDQAFPLVMGENGEPAVLSPEAQEAFSIKTRGRIGKKPAAKTDKPSKWKEEHEGEPPPPPGENDAQQKKIFTPLVLAGAIGGGTLVLGLVIALVCLMLLGRGSKSVAEAPSTAKAATPAAAAKTEEPAEANPATPAVEKNPELNPAEPAMANEPAAKTEAATSSKAGESPIAAITAATTKATTEDKASTPEPAVVPAATEVKPEPVPETKPEMKPESKPEPKPEAKPAPKPPAKAAPPANPFQGLAKAVQLRDLPDGPADASGDVATPLPLGPCQIDDSAPLAVTLLGGDNAIRAPKQKFELQPKSGGNREWNFVFTGGAAAVTVATLAVKEKEIVFQWTEDGVKQAQTAKQLSNCALDLSSGSARHTLALRTPLQGQPLAVEIDKTSANVKWNIPDLPPAKYVFVEVTSTEEIKKYKQEPKEPVSLGESITVWTGPTDKSVPLALKLSITGTARNITVSLAPSAKFEGDDQPKPYRKKELVTKPAEITQLIQAKQSDLIRAKSTRPLQENAKLLKDQQVNQITNDLVQLNTRLDQINYLTGFTETFHGTAKINFRVYYQAGATKVDLLRTEPEGAEKPSK